MDAKGAAVDLGGVEGGVGWRAESARRREKSVWVESQSW